MLREQLEEFLSWKAMYAPFTVSTYKMNLEEFIAFTKAECISHISGEIIHSFLMSQRTQFQIFSCAKSIRGLLRYWGRQVICFPAENIKDDGTVNLHDSNIFDKVDDMEVQKRKVGRPFKNAENMEMVERLRGVGLSFQAISRALKRDVKEVYRWHKMLHREQN